MSVGTIDFAEVLQRTKLTEVQITEMVRRSVIPKPINPNALYFVWSWKAEVIEPWLAHLSTSGGLSLT